MFQMIKQVYGKEALDHIVLCLSGTNVLHSGNTVLKMSMLVSHEKSEHNSRSKKLQQHLPAFPKW
jgi:hypothetical protein